MWTEWAARWVAGIAVGAILAWWGIGEHVWWLYVAGVLIIGLVPGSLFWVLWARRRPEGPVRWVLAGLVVLLVAAPSIALPWSSYRSQLASHAEWLVEADRTPTVDGQFVVDDRAYLLDELDLTVVDHRTGEVVAEVPIGVGFVSVGAGGTIYAQSSDDRPVTAYDETGAKLWQRPGNAVAATADTTVLRTCRGPIESPSDCRLVGVDTTTGAERWTRPIIRLPNDATWVRQAELPSFNLGFEGWWPTVLPELAVLEPPGGSEGVQVVDPDTGDSVQQLRGGDVGLAGDLVVHAAMAGDTCVVRSYRDGREEWASDSIPRGDCPGPLDLVGTRLYFRTDDTITMNLDDGSWRRVGQVEIGPTGDYDADLHTGVGDDDVIVYRDGVHEIFAVDAETGEELWRRETTGDDPAGLTVAHGAVTVYTTANTHNPFVPEDIADEGYVETVLDARTGEVTGSWIGHWSSLWTSLPVGPGRALILTDDGLFPVGRDDEQAGG